MNQTNQTFASVPSQPIPIPPRSLNGGLYTGEPFKKNAAWANVPAIPDVDFLTQQRVSDYEGVNQARFQYPGSVRPGNNSQKMPGVIQGPSGLQCIKNPDPPMTWASCQHPR